jgi:Acetyltransferase (GNAT) family
MLMPEAFLPAHAPELLVALDASAVMIAAAAIGWASVGDPPAFPLAIHVVPARRRMGVGRALVRAAVEYVLGEATALRPWTTFPAESQAAEFCLATGFAVHHRVLYFAGEAEVLERTLAMYREKLDRAGWIPSGARVVTLPEASDAEVANLVCREFGASPGAMLARLRGRGGKAFLPERSVVLLLDGVVVGAQLVTMGDDGIPDVEANVVIPTLRRGWANLVLTHEATRIGVANGSRRFRFFCDDRVIDTVNLARRCGAERTREDLVLVRSVPEV